MFFPFYLSAFFISFAFGLKLLYGIATSLSEIDSLTQNQTQYGK